MFLFAVTFSVSPLPGFSAAFDAGFPRPYGIIRLGFRTRGGLLRGLVFPAFGVVCEHSFAVMLPEFGADVKTLQKQLGHGSATITLDTYAGLWPERLNDLADAVDDARTKTLELAG